MSLTLASNWLGNLVFQVAVPPMVSFLSPGVTFMIFAGCCTITSLLVYWLVPETKGVALESMDEVFGSRFWENAMQKGSLPLKKLTGAADGSHASTTPENVSGSEGP